MTKLGFAVLFLFFFFTNLVSLCVGGVVGYYYLYVKVSNYVYEVQSLLENNCGQVEIIPEDEMSTPEEYLEQKDLHGI